MFSIIEKHYNSHFNQLVKKYSFRLSKEEAEDVVQEAYYRALKYAPSFEMGTSFTKWFNSILHNSWKDYLEAKYRDGMHEDLDDNPDIVDTGVDLDTPSVREVLDKHISKVGNPSHNQILRLYFIFHYPLSDIKEITDETYSNVKQIIQRFKTSMKERVNEEDMRRGFGS